MLLMPAWQLYFTPGQLALIRLLLLLGLQTHCIFIPCHSFLPCFPHSNADNKKRPLQTAVCFTPSCPLKWQPFSKWL